MSANHDDVLDHGHNSSRFVLVTEHDPHKNTTFHISAKTLAQAAGVNPNDPCMYASSLKNLEVQHVTAAHHTGIVLKSGDDPVGQVRHPAFTHVSHQETGGYHIVASKGHNDFSQDPVAIDLQDPTLAHPESHDPLKYVKRATRWRTDVGATAEQLVAGLEKHEGQNKQGANVTRVLVPLHGDHACTRALALNANATEGPFAQYNTKNRKIVTTHTGDHVVVEQDHLMNIASTLQKNLEPSTAIGQHGVTFHFKPLPNQHESAQPGKIVVKFKINRTPTHHLFGSEYEAPTASTAKITIKHAQSALSTGTLPEHGLPNDAAIDKRAQDLSSKILNMRIGAKSNAGLAANNAASSITTFAHTDETNDFVAPEAVHAVVDDDGND